MQSLPIQFVVTIPAKQSQILQAVVSVLAAFDDVMRVSALHRTTSNRFSRESKYALTAPIFSIPKLLLAFLPVRAIQPLRTIHRHAAPLVPVAQSLFGFFVTHPKGSRCPRLIHPQPDF